MKFDNNSTRISKRLADLGIDSRRNCEKLVTSGGVKVNNVVITDLWYKVTNDDEIQLNNKVITNVKRKDFVYLMNKPTGYITTTKDPQNRPTVFDLLPKHLGRLIKIGRLDFNTEGLLLFTNNGEFARQMELPSSHIKRVYEVTTHGHITQLKLNQLQHGVTIKGIHYGTFVAQIIKQQGLKTIIRVTIFEGKNREIRKIMEYLNLIVVKLVRIQYGNYFLSNAGQVIDL